MKHRKIIAALAAICMLTASLPLPGSVPETVYADETASEAPEYTTKMDELLCYRIYADHVEVGAFNYPLEPPDQLTIPSEYAGLPVTAVYESGFRNCYAKEILLPETIERINRWAFSSCEAEHIHLPDGLKSIEFSAFAFSTLLRYSLELMKS